MADGHGNGFIETIKTVVFAVVIALAVRTVAYEPFNIPSGSMKPTLLVGDYLFVSKFSYGYSKYSMPFSMPIVPGRILFSEPERGDVFVFKLPTDTNIDYIKRIIGLPGDTIQLKNSILYINGDPVKRERIEEFVEKIDDKNFRKIPQYIETLPNGKSHLILEYTEDTQFDNTPVYTVPEGHYFGMGDNRDRSRDSRFLQDVGYIPQQNLVGRAEVLFFSIDGAFWKFWEWGNTLRGSRFFSGIE